MPAWYATTRHTRCAASNQHMIKTSHGVGVSKWRQQSLFEMWFAPKDRQALGAGCWVLGAGCNTRLEPGRMIQCGSWLPLFYDWDFKGVKRGAQECKSGTRFLNSACSEIKLG